MEGIELRQRDAALARVNEIFAQLLWTFIRGGAATILLLSTFAWRATRKLGQPIRNLARGIEAVASGALDQRLSISTRDEIGASPATSTR